MASNLNISDAAAAAMVQALCDYMDSGASTARLRLYSDDGTPDQPTDADTAVGAGMLLVELAFAEPCEASIVGGTVTFDALTPGVAVASGTAVWFRVVNGNGDTVFDGTLGTSGADLNMNSVAITLGATVSAPTGITWTLPQ